MSANLGAAIRDQPWDAKDPAVVLLGAVVVGRAEVQPLAGGRYTALLLRDTEGHIWALYHDPDGDHFEVALHLTPTT